MNPSKNPYTAQKELDFSDIFQNLPRPLIADAQAEAPRNALQTAPIQGHQRGVLEVPNLSAVARADRILRDGPQRK